MGWDIKRKVSVRYLDGRIRRLASHLRQAEPLFKEHFPRNFSLKKLRKNRVRIYHFPKAEKASEIFSWRGNSRYVSLRAGLLSKRYWAGLQYTLHGLAHSFCYLRDGISEEVFCEHVAFSVLKKLLKGYSPKFRRRILKSVLRITSKEYDNYYKAAQRLTRRNPKILVRLNAKALHRRIPIKIEKQIVYRALKGRTSSFEELEEYKINLERGFCKPR